MPELTKFIEHDTGAYAITNLANGKVYVGGAYKSFKQRFDQHKTLLRANKHYNIYLQRAWNKHGEALFEFRILERCRPVDCQRVEQKWLDKTNSCDPAVGYNLHPTAGSPLGYKHSDYTKAVMGLGQQIRFEDAEQRAKNGHNKGRVFSDEWCASISSGLIERFKSPEERAKVASKGESNGRAIMTEQTVKEMRKLRKNDPIKFTCKVLAKMYGVSPGVVHRIITRVSWKHVADETEEI